ncbi:MAG: bifunctional diaminohydroxyphosphoribosylaminopyrimidine deaminase/5-amino-6-(5-phosphoribosylamino)uracil reductase RibD [Cyclobacteriaceae bacterium]|nr:bifunctional diaminohydroxyphosphoribosylaminopyrimidine deaminase/5-amino-6-(5-phosphoribosylamino)uracil reductase RibD [Cyclobacteriaceae bacterium]MDH5251409.1 bifunctional diaminohydroxyphosphoribosylaminopyrimidine deaminase/5-amino-6-(5-phosphoribosylamino)uracil reductase RibD [Cyclobacteriaceae bacterium]
MSKHDHHIDEVFMNRALELAAQGHGTVSPNPLVGSVVVHENKIIGEGWHKKYGEAHAEVNAIHCVANKNFLKHSTVYANLEPCSHFGKTPPCTDLLIAHRVQKVVIANLDPNPLVAGNGVKKLRSAGIEVITGILAEEGQELNRRFFTFMAKRRPYIVLKWAETADGFIARENYDSKWISNEFSRQVTHKWRAEEDAILVGSKTVAHDNPQLNVRDWSGENPVRIVIDRFLKLDDKLLVFDKAQRTILYNFIKHEEHPNLSIIRLDEKDFLNNLMQDLFNQEIQSVLVEGGATTLNLFIEQGLWDEARIFRSPRIFEKGIRAPMLHGKCIDHYHIQSDTLSIFRPAVN